ncbi:ubiquitin domain-containing protein [Cavenderia fasciculata]|uniref:Ubiquitin carboxyl-terminal hydrolase n=1 Tax=Cavenderia fasciculata TaxID=261658 RepID=F4PRE3_CACFS|nr:ubiquitin domain-containing protein [Cavenderia fasciculata]EGG20495.1 ubiquitin domain-containing protein [Cavenderia fasciculata]|eukprot:XP_004358345.1 ubiquitin domain-containing protein [Cavenderia fasciculata]
MVKVVVKWTKEKYDVDVDPSESVLEFKSKLYSLSHVPTDRQKIMGFKGGILKDDASWKDLDLVEGKVLMMVGSAEELPQPKQKITFVEDLPQQQADALIHNMPSGLYNLGNTCYLNATLQCMKACPELMSIIKKYKPTGTQYSALVKASQGIFNELSKTTGEPVGSSTFLNLFRALFPQFGEIKEGAYMQQDADEAWSQLLSAYANEFPINANDKSTNPTQAVEKSFIGKLFGIGVTDTYQCKENPSEESTSRSETLLKLPCNIGTETSYLFEGIKRGLEEDITKKSPSLNKEAVYTKKTTLNHLPPYLMVQFVRFNWKQGVKKPNDQGGVTGVKTKIIRQVQFPFTLDIFDFCSQDLKDNLSIGRKRLDDEFNASLERKRKTFDGQEQGGKQKKETKEEEIFDITADEDASKNSTGKFELKAVLTHQGRFADSGHYVAWVKKDDNKWLKFDDTTVYEVNDEEIKKLQGGGEWHMAYMCLYKAIKAPEEDKSSSTPMDTSTTTTTTTNQ